MPPLAILQRDGATRARLRSALHELHELLFLPDWEELWDVVQTGDVAGCVVDAYDDFRPVPMRELLRLRRRQPAVAIVVYSDFTDREMELFELGRHKLDGVILAGAGDTPRVIRETITHALAIAVASRVVWALGGRVPPVGLDALRWSVEHAHREPGVDELAGALAHEPRQLARCFRHEELPSPRRMLLWGRLFRAAHMLEAADRTVEEVAFSLGYASGTGLARAFRRATGEPPSGVMRAGGVARVLDAFHRERTGRGVFSGRRRTDVPIWTSA